MVPVKCSVFVPGFVHSGAGAPARSGARLPRGCLRPSLRGGLRATCIVPHCGKAPRCPRESWGAPRFPFGFLMVFNHFPASPLRVCTAPIAAPASAPRAGGRCAPGMGRPGMAPRRARPGRRAVPGFARGTLIYLWFSKDFSVATGNTKSTTISNVFERFLFCWLIQGS